MSEPNYEREFGTIGAKIDNLHSDVKDLHGDLKELAKSQQALWRKHDTHENDIDMLQNVVKSHGKNIEEHKALKWKSIGFFGGMIAIWELCKHKLGF